MSWTAVTWLVTGTAAAMLVVTRAAEGGRPAGEPHDRVSVSAALQTVLGLLAFALWGTGLSADNRRLLLAGLALWWLAAIAGLFLLVCRLPSGGRHSDRKAAVGRSRGGLAPVAHLVLLGAACFFTFVVVTGRI